MKTSRSRRQGFLLYWGGIAALFAILVCSAPWINAQIATTTATLSGVVTDSTGALVPKATVTLTSSEKGISRTFTTDDGGRYSFNQLPPAGYSLAIKAKGFKTYQQNGIVLNAAETATQNVTLTVGAESTSITVTSDVALLNTDNANVAADIDGKQIVELPLNVRNVYGLATLNSSVQNTSEGQLLLGGGSSNSTDTADQDISFMNFAGGFFGTTAFLIDGAWDTDTEWGAVIFVPGVDATQEFKIQNNSFTAQYGWSTGNVINVVTKSGTNTFHGSAYEFYSNNNFNALNFFQSPGSCQGLLNTNLCTFSRNQNGVTAGGPLYIPGLYKQRNKTFIYGIYDHFTANTPSPSQFTVPDTNFLAGNFSEQLGGQAKDTNGNLIFDALGRPVYTGAIYDPRSGHAITEGAADTKTAGNPYGTGLVATSTGYIRNPIPGNILSAANLPVTGYTPDAVGSKLLSYYPTAQIAGNVPNNLTLAGVTPTYWDEYGIRADQNINENTTAYFRYSYKKEAKTGEANNWGSNPAGQGNQRPNNRWGMWAGLTRLFSPTFTMNITSGVQIWHETSDNQSFGFNPSTTLGLPAYVSQQYPLFPIVNMGQGISQLGPIAGNQQGVTNHGPIGTVAVDFIKTHGKNTVSFGFMGVEQVFSQFNYANASLTFDGNFTAGPNPITGVGAVTGNGVAEMLLGVMDGAGVGTPTTPYLSNHLFGEYLQDDWKPTSKLTLNLGIRYEIQTPYTLRHNQGSVFDPNALNPLSSMAGEPLLGALQFLGPGNRDTYNPNHDNIAPRIGFSYQAIPKAVIHGGYGIFYPEAVTSSSPVDSDGFTASTSANLSLNGGVTPNPNISTSNPWGGVYAQITGNVNGSFQQDGNGAGSDFISRPSPYVQQWLLGVQYAFTPNDQLDVNYIGNRGVRMVSGWNYNQLNPKYLSEGSNYLSGTAAFNPLAAPLQQLEKGGTIAPSSCNIDSATSLQNYQLLLAYPQYCGVSQTDAPVGQSLYNSLQVTYNHRISKGLTALVSYTYSKFLDNVEGNNSWSYNGAANWGATANYFNIAGEKSVDAGDIPQALVASYVYKLPIGRGQSVGSGMSRVADAVVGGWELSGIATFKGGLPISVLGNDWNSYGGDPRPDVVGNPKPAHQKISSTVLNSWINYSAFAFAPYGDFGNAPRYFSNLRGPHYQNWDTALEKNWKFRQSMRAQFRLETFNSFNHPNFYAPGPGNARIDVQNAFGLITTAFPGRIVQWAGKFYW
ncbi:MAG: carboxypeptidase-like regulatory domain-containing protein [Terracidiphilus sp.]